MVDFIDECVETVSRVQELLKHDTEWMQRYDAYASKIHENIEKIREDKTKFYEWPPLNLYMTVLQAKGQMLYSLRYLGQDVAKIKVGKGNITITTKDFSETNERDFDCCVKLEGDGWRTEKAKEFRKHFSKNPPRTELSKKKNEEHRLESLLLTEFTKQVREEKLIVNIQPVKLADHVRFQMPTPLGASSMKNLKYSGAFGGGIDIISRVGIGSSTKLCIMEVKDENNSKEPPAKVIQQGLAYATFVRELLRTKSGETWWKIFGFKRNIPATLEIYVVCAMPLSITNNDTSFANVKIKADPENMSTYPDDSFHLHYLYFQEQENQFTDISTSLPKCQTSRSPCPT